MKKVIFVFFLLHLVSNHPEAQGQPAFKVLALSEDGGHHLAYTERAKIWLKQLSEEHRFTIDYLRNTASINKEQLEQYDLFIQLDYPPYNWSDASKTAFQEYIEEGKGGWIGFHHATLLGEFDGFTLWNWFSDFMGGIRYKNYIATFASATVNNENRLHPVMKDLPDSFIIDKEEWYIYDKSPRQHVKVLASADETTYSPDSEIKMGDHPVIWTNEKVQARNVYIFMGHSPLLFDNPVYTKIFTNAIFWAAEK